MEQVDIRQRKMTSQKGCLINDILKIWIFLVGIFFFCIASFEDIIYI